MTLGKIIHAIICMHIFFTKYSENKSKSDNVVIKKCRSFSSTPHIVLSEIRKNRYISDNKIFLIILFKHKEKYDFLN